MSTASIQSAIERFLAESTNGLLVLRGSWGVGKTYLWRALLKKARLGKKLTPELYSYVSLFGVNSLDQLKETIVLSYANPVDNPGKFENLWKSIKSISLGSNKTGLVAKWVPLTASQLFPGVKDTLVCMDDLERSGKNLDIQDVVGLLRCSRRSVAARWFLF
jgi:Cdc6-like AAA superfamily ATPase